MDTCKLRRFLITFQSNITPVGRDTTFFTGRWYWLLKNQFKAFPSCSISLIETNIKNAIYKRTLWCTKHKCQLGQRQYFLITLYVLTDVVQVHGSSRYHILCSIKFLCYYFQCNKVGEQQFHIQSDQKVSVHLMITIHKVTSNVQSVSCQSPDIYWHVELCSRRPCSV